MSCTNSRPSWLNLKTVPNFKVLKGFLFYKSGILSIQLNALDISGEKRKRSRK